MMTGGCWKCPPVMFIGRGRGMVYRIIVDGKKMYEERLFSAYSLETDKRKRKEIVEYYRNEKGAEEVIIDTTTEEVRTLHEIAETFSKYVIEFDDLLYGLPDEEWEPDEMELLIPALMNLFMAAMKLPNIECIEDKRPGIIECRSRKETPIQFAERYCLYWNVFDPYENVCGNENDEKYNVCMMSLIDDIASVSGDLLRGMEEYANGRICRAIWEWKLGFLSHWGSHATHALSAMSFAYREAIDDRWFDEDECCWEEEDED